MTDQPPFDPAAAFDPLDTAAGFTSPPPPAPNREEVSAEVVLSFDLNEITRRYLGEDQYGNESYMSEVLHDKVIDMAARHLAAQIGKDWRAEIKRKVSDMFDAIARERINQIVTEAFESDLQKTDGFGNPVGPPTNVGALIAATAEKWFNEESGSYDRRQKNGVKVINELIDGKFKAKVKEAVTATESQTIAIVSAHAGKLLSQAVQELAAANKIQLNQQ